jgi:NAD-dependent dihydropyrimidine dehydrogenase PreA subunit
MYGEDGIAVRVEDKNVWLTAEAMAELIQKTYLFILIFPSEAVSKECYPALDAGSLEKYYLVIRRLRVKPAMTTSLFGLLRQPHVLEAVKDGTGIHVVVKYPDKCNACEHCLPKCKFNALKLIETQIWSLLILKSTSRRRVEKRFHHLHRLVHEVFLALGIFEDGIDDDFQHIIVRQSHISTYSPRHYSRIRPKFQHVALTVGKRNNPVPVHNLPHFVEGIAGTVRLEGKYGPLLPLEIRRVGVFGFHIVEFLAEKRRDYHWGKDTRYRKHQHQLPKVCVQAETHEQDNHHRQIKNQENRNPEKK